MACNYVFKIDRIAHNILNNSTRFVEFSIHSSLLESPPKYLGHRWTCKGCFERLFVSLKRDSKYLVFTDSKGRSSLIDTWLDLYKLIYLNKEKSMMTNAEIVFTTVELPLENSSASEVEQEKLKLTIQEKDAENLRLSDRIKVLENGLLTDVRNGSDSAILGLLEKMETRMNKQDADIIRILNESRNTKSSPARLPATTIHPKEPVNTVLETDSVMKDYYDDEDDDEDYDDDDEDDEIFQSGSIASKVDSYAGKPILTEEVYIPCHSDPLIAASIERMLISGYTDEGGWLTRLVEAKKGDLNAVYRVFNKK